MGDAAEDDAAADVVERERAELVEFAKGLSPEDIRSGNWFTKLLGQGLSSYTDKVDWQYFQQKYEGVPADAVVEQRIKMAARYAAVEGGVSASAYSAAVMASLGTLGATVPAAVLTVMADVAFTTQLQLRLAHDISVLYRIPLDVSDPEDLWKLIRVAFTIKSGEVVREGVVKVVPIMVRPLVKSFYTGPVLAAGKGLPVVGKYLLQRNAIKIGIPLVGVPLAVVLNRWTTLVAGAHARAVFRNEARVVELASNLVSRSAHAQLLLWVAWLVIISDGAIHDDEAVLMRHLVRCARDRHQVVDSALAELVDLDPSEVWRRLDAEAGDLGDLVAAARAVAAVDGAVNKREKAVIAELEKHCRG